MRCRLLHDTWTYWANDLRAQDHLINSVRCDRYHVIWVMVSSPALLVLMPPVESGMDIVLGHHDPPASQG